MPICIVNSSKDVLFLAHRVDRLTVPGSRQNGRQFRLEVTISYTTTYRPGYLILLSVTVGLSLVSRLGASRTVLLCQGWKQEIWANAHETRESISLIAYAGCHDLSPVISAQFTLEMCVAARNREKFTKTPHFGGSRSFKVIDVGTPGKVVSSACYDKQ